MVQISPGKVAGFPRHRWISRLPRSAFPPVRFSPAFPRFSHYTLEGLEDGGTRIEVTVETDLKGNVPDRLVRRAGPDWPAYTLSGLMQRASSDDITIDDWLDE